MSEFNYKQWIQDNKVGPYQKTTLFESMQDRFGVMSKNKHHLVAYPDPQGGYTKEELSAWYAKGQEAGQTRQVEYVDSREEAKEATDKIDEETYDQAYNDGGNENPQPEDEQFQEMDSMQYYDIAKDAEATNDRIEYYSNAELNMDNDRMPSNYSIPNPGGNSDLDAAWKPKPFNNARTSGRFA